jgi:hypothetical protein
LVFGEGADEFGRGVKIEIRVPAAGGFRVKHRFKNDRGRRVRFNRRFARNPDFLTADGPE